MDAHTEQRIPPVPHWRWLTYHALLDREHPEIDEDVRLLVRHLQDTCETRPEQFEEVGLMRVLEHEQEHDPVVARVLRLREEPPIHNMIEDMLLEHCELDWIEEAVYHKFSDQLGEEVLALYRDLFFDTTHSNRYQVQQYQGGDYPDAPPVPGPMRSAYRAYQSGVDIDIDHGQMAEDVLHHAYFRSKELAQFGVPADELVLDYMSMTLKAYKTLQDSDFATDEGLPELFDRPVKYADESAVSADELDGYDPVEDSGYEEDTDE